MKICHCKTCAESLHVIIVIIAIVIPHSLASCLIRFPFLHTCILFTSPHFYALSIVHDTSSKNAKLSSATTLFPWRHTNTSKNHGYNAVAGNSHRQPFRAEDSALAPDEEGQKVRQGQIFSEHIYPAVSSRPRGRCVQSLVLIGSEMWICIRYKLTNKQTFSSIYKILFGAEFLSYSLLSKYTMVKTYRIVILPVVSYESEAWSFTLRKEHRPTMFENSVLRKIFGSKWDEEQGSLEDYVTRNLKTITCHQMLFGWSNQRKWVWRGM